MRARADLYPGDEVINKAIGETLRHLRLESGMSIEQAEEAFRQAIAKVDYRRFYKALGLTIKEERVRQGISRHELSRLSRLSGREMTLLERGQLQRMPASYLFRISYALKISPAILARRFEAIQEKIAGSGRQNG